MSVVADLVLSTGRDDLAVLDLPAGNGLLADYLRERGCRVTCGDINSERDDYVHVNMEERLPFNDGSFDVVICLEGIEHVIEPARLVRELCRVVRKEGVVILSLPNVQSFYSRLKFLLTGVFYQFEPDGRRHPKGRLIDRGHVSPLTLVQLDYIFGEYGWQLHSVAGDRIKRKLLLPIYGVLWVCQRACSVARRWRCRKDDVRRLYAFLDQPRAMLSRSLITVWRSASESASATS